MGTAILQNKVNLFIMPNGYTNEVGSALSAMSVDKHSFTGQTDATIPGRGQDYGYDVFGRIRVKNTFQEAPGGLQTATIEFDREVDIDFLELMRDSQQEFGIWVMSSPCGRRDNPYAWLDGGRLDFHGKATVTGFSGGDAPARDGTATPVVASADITWEYDVALRPLGLNSATPAIATNDQIITGIFGLKEPMVPGCFPGYQGPDKHLWIVSEGAVAAAANVHFSRNGGSTWTVMTNDPFGTNEDISDGDVIMMQSGVARVIVGNGTGTSAQEIAYADVTFGNEAAATWTTVTVAAVASDTINKVEALFYNGVYASGGTANDDLWVSTDQGETWTLVVTGAGDAINAIAKGYGQDCEDVYIAGASNMIQVDRGRTNSFVSLVGPSGGGTFTALAIDNDGVIYAGNGTSLFVSSNKGATAGGWTSLKNFTASHVVKNIFFPKGDSNHIYVVVDDTTPGSGEFWHSNDRGNSWRKVTELSNQGYNDAFKSSENQNLYLIVGDVVSSYGAVHKATPSTAGC